MLLGAGAAALAVLVTLGVVAVVRAGSSGTARQATTTARPPSSSVTSPAPASTVPVVSTTIATASSTAASTAASTVPPTSPPTVAATPVPGTTPQDALVVATDMPLQGAAAELSADANKAMQLVLDRAGGRAGAHRVTLRPYDDSTEAKGSWDDALCRQNGALHAATTDEVAVVGTYNSGCSRYEVPLLNRAPGGPLLMISHGNSNPGLTKPWDAGEPGRYYPTGVRNYGRVVPTDDLQGVASVRFAAKVLGLRRCIVLDDGQTYGVGIARSFRAAAAAEGVEIVGTGRWDGRQASYLDLFGRFGGLGADCVFLGGIDDNNGEQLITDKVAVLGPNDGAVKLLAPDGFLGYPSVQRLPAAANMYLSYSGVPASELVKRGGACAEFARAFAATYGHEPVSAYAFYAAAALQYILASIAQSDGSRRGVRDAAFSGVTIPVEESILGVAFSLDPATGDVSLHDFSINRIQNQAEVFLQTIDAG